MVRIKFELPPFEPRRQRRVRHVVTQLPKLKSTLGSCSAPCPALPPPLYFLLKRRVPMPHSLRQHLCARSYIKALEDGMTARRANRIISRRTKIQRLAKYASSCYTRWTRYAPFHAFLGIYSHRLFDLAPNTNTRCRSHSRLPSKWTSAAFDACSLSELPASLPHLHPVNPEPHIPNSHARESPSTYISPVRGSYNACTLRPRSHPRTNVSPYSASQRLELSPVRVHLPTTPTPIGLCNFRRFRRRRYPPMLIYARAPVRSPP